MSMFICPKCGEQTNSGFSCPKGCGAALGRVSGYSDGSIKAENDRLKAKLERITLDLSAASHREEMLLEALTPSAETKAEYIGEFQFPMEGRDEDGDECTLQVYVPWSTIKDIMKAIRERALAKPGQLAACQRDLQCSEDAHGFTESLADEYKRERDAALERVKRLETALEFYAKEPHWGNTAIAALADQGEGA